MAARGLHVRRCAGVAATAVLVWTAGCGQEADQQRPRVADRAPRQVVAGMVLRESQAGRLSWVLRADSAYHYGDAEPTRLLGVVVDFYNEAGDSIRSRLTARSGELNPAARDVVARDSVVVATDEGVRLETDELRWVQEIEKVVSDRFVRLTRGRSVVTGIGIESDAGLRTYRILSEVSGELREEDAASGQPPAEAR